MRIAARWLKIGGALLLAIAATPPVLSQEGRPSFKPGVDCSAGENSPLSRWVCSDAGVERLSVRLNKLYRALQMATDDAGRFNLQKANNDWLDQLDDQCGRDTSKSCVLEALKSRLKQLGGTTETAQRPATMVAAPRPLPTDNKPSFDCAAAKSASARLICSDLGLREADRELGEAFQSVIKNLDGDDRKDEIQDQVKWIRERNTRCGLNGRASAPISELRSSWQCMMDALIARKNEFIGQKPTASAALSSAPTPESSQLLSQEEIDGFRKFMASWNPAPGTPPLDVHFRLKRDGTIDGTPEVLSTGTGSTFEAAKNDAVRTLLQAQPFKMFRPESYDAWKDMIVTFEPQTAQQVQDLSPCAAKYEAAKAAGTIGDISRESFLKICALTASPVVPDASNTQQSVPTLPLKPGTYVSKVTSCGDASNSTIMYFDGRVFTGGHGYRCEIAADRASGPSYECVFEGARNTFTIVSETEVDLANPVGAFSYRYCRQNSLPAVWRSAQ